MSRPGISQARAMAAVARKELRQIVRDRQTLGLLLFVPVFFLLLYGYALNFDIRHVPLAVEDRDHSVESRDLIASFTNSTYFDLAATVRSGAEIERLMDGGEIRAAVVIPEGFSRRIRTGQADVQVLVAGDDANTATSVVGYVQAIVRELSARLAGPGARPLVQPEPRVWYNPELRTTLFLVPGLIAYIATITSIISTALSLVREKERGTIEQVRMAPVGTAAFVLGKTIPYFGIGLVSALLIIVAAMALFGMPMRGSWLDLLAATSLFLAGALGFGLLISTVAESQQVAFQISTIAAFLPTFILSGFIFPIASMPVAIQAVTYAVPARYYLSALRAIVLKGAGTAVIAPELIALAVFAVLVLILSAVRFGRQSLAAA